MRERDFSQPNTQPLAVLCVGADSARAESLADRLEQTHADLSASPKTDPAAALSRLDTNGVDCIVSTYDLSDGDGLSFLRRVREDHGEVPFVLLAGAGSDAIAAEALNADADGYFEREDGSVPAERIVDRVETLVEAYRRRQAQCETRQRLLEVAEKFESAVWLFTADWSEAIFVNSTYEDIWGRSREALRDDPTDCLDGIHPDDRAAAREAMARLTVGESVELVCRVNATEEYRRWVAIQGEPVFDAADNLQYVAGFARDITDRKERRRELRDKTRQLQGILNAVEASVFMVDTEGRHLLMNPAAREQFGVDEDADIVGSRLEELVDERMAREVRANMDRALDAEETIEFEKTMPADGESRTFLIRLSPVVTRDGDIYAICGFGTDITDQKRREARLEQQTEEMEVFNSLLRHDVLNGMTVVRTRGAKLADALDGHHQDHAETIVEWSDNVTNLVQRIRDVLETLSGEEPDLERVHLSRGVRQQVEHVAKTYPDVEFETDIPDDVYIEANDLLADVFKNLLTNAVEHNERDGLRVDATVETGAEHATVHIADNGCGIPDTQKDEVFRRGATGHAEQTGSGFGLFFVNAMVAAYGGDVHIEDSEAGGATFVITLPLADPTEQRCSE